MKPRSDRDPQRCMPSRYRTAVRLALATSLCVALHGRAQGETSDASPLSDPPVEHLRIVGGVADVNPYTRHEASFWTTTLPRLSDGSASAEIVPFDRAGIRAEEMLRLVKLNVVSFGTVLLNAGAVVEPELAAPDLAGLNPDGNALERSVESFRPHLRRLLRERYEIELLALYTYPAQVTFCTKPMAKLADLAGRRIGTSGAAQSDWVAALGAIPVQTAFTDIVSQVRNGNIDCAIAGTMSGNAIGLHEVTSYLHGMPVTWGVAAFVANGDAWNALSSELQALMRRELPKLEQAIATESARETGEGIACNIGAAACISGRKGRMTEVRPSRADGARRRRILATMVVPAWQQRCGPRCVQLWTQTVGPASGIDPAGPAAPQPARTAQASR